MMKTSQYIKYLKAHCKKVLKNKQGTAAVEFALIAPLMLATYFGCVEVSNIFITKNKIETISETAADLITQSKSTNLNEIQEIFSISTTVLTAEEESRFNLVFTSVRTLPNNNGNPQTTVQWSESKTGANTRAIDAVYDELPGGMATLYETIIVTELYYNHKAIFEYFIKGEKSFDRRFLNKPRYSSDIPCSDC